jgi:hypothetical protein
VVPAIATIERMAKCPPVARGVNPAERTKATFAAGETSVRQRERNIAPLSPHAAQRVPQKLSGCARRNSSLILWPFEISDAPEEVPTHRNQFPTFLSPIIQNLFYFIQFGRFYSNDKIFPHGRHPLLH